MVVRAVVTVVVMVALDGWVGGYGGGASPVVMVARGGICLRRSHVNVDV